MKTESLIVPKHQYGIEDKNMKDQKGEVVKVRSGGRVTIPKNLLNKKGIKDGDYVLLKVERIRMEIEESK